MPTGSAAGNEAQLDIAASVMFVLIAEHSKYACGDDGGGIRRRLAKGTASLSLKGHRWGSRRTTRPRLSGRVRGHGLESETRRGR